MPSEGRGAPTILHLVELGQGYRSSAFKDPIHAALTIIFLLLRAVLQGSSVLHKPDRHLLIHVVRIVEFDCIDASLKPPAAPLKVIAVLPVLFAHVDVRIDGELSALSPDFSQVLLRVRLIEDRVNVIKIVAT